MTAPTPDALTDLVRRLRADPYRQGICHEAADAIEALRRERDEARAALDEFTRMPTDAELDAAEAARTPEEKRRLAAVCEIVVHPDLVDDLRAQLAGAENERDEWRAMCEDAERRLSLAKEVADGK